MYLERRLVRCKNLYTPLRDCFYLLTAISLPASSLGSLLCHGGFISLVLSSYSRTPVMYALFRSLSKSFFFGLCCKISSLVSWGVRLGAVGARAHHRHASTSLSPLSHCPFVLATQTQVRYAFCLSGIYEKKEIFLMWWFLFCSS